MCLLLFEIIMCGVGCYALAAGRLSPMPGRVTIGRRARIAGAFLIAPLPLAFGLGLLLGLLSERGAFSNPPPVIFLELLLVLCGLIGAALVLSPELR
ncbi:MAG TPA: hypothetical protein ENN14_02780 [Chloroflexi bacterium]|nr:hypothetical protein [Chloroflexota bacterium]